MAIGNRQTVFAYKTIKGPLHRLPALAKLISLVPLSLLCMSLPLPALGAGIALLALAALVLKFSPREQFTDLRPVLFYGLLMYALSVFSQLAEITLPVPLRELFMNVLIPQNKFVHMFLRLLIIVQLSALLFRTTSMLEIRDCLSISAFTTRFSGSFALFAGFIPEIFQAWTQIDRAWQARGGRNGFTKIRALVFILITLSFEKAARKAVAMAARER